ncbi:DNA polymerase III alpha subunit [Dysgonomonas alginatilytica]|uniref:DNA polymerase III alpha subunit n=1 Tax=Dysgonomonas alginatilytica TaxID=1605892 RepID=A0A2V3PJW8_9BACT|nr:DNA polymerase III alpha subunit [Dysgonomonas alginatilytica]
MFLELLEEGLKAKVEVRHHKKYRERLEQEVYIIESTNNVDYFLIQWDMVKEARKRKIAVGIGRGSAGGSLVSYLLGIISIDPIRYDLIFSRFLVPERCGLNWVDDITVIGQDMHVGKGEKVIEVNLEDRQVVFYGKAELRIIRDDKEMTVFAYNLQPGDEIQFDNRDLLWTLNELLK